MHFDTRVTLDSMEVAERPGFPEPYREAVFRLASDGIAPVEVRVWVHRAWPADQAETVARSFLAGRLADMATAAGEGAYTPEELDRLWRSVSKQAGP